MADKRIQQYPEKVAPSTNDYLLIADAEDADVNGFLKYKKLKISGLDNIVITNAEDITLTALNALISTNTLVVGRFYRITDSLSGINPIIVQAVAMNVLSELAIDSDTGLVYSYDVSTDTVTPFPSKNVYIPYVGATSDVDLGEYQIKVGQLELDQTPTGTFGVGKMRWNDTDGTAEIKLKGNNVTLQIGQEQLARVVNKTGVNLTEADYKVVRISGSQGQRLKVGLAQANSTTTSKDTLGLVTENINNNAEGFITTSGLVRDIDTTGSLQGETWADGDRLFLSPSVSGGITKVEPTSPNLVIVLGYVVYAHANQGSIYVSVDGAKGLHELFDVSIPNPTNKNILVYESSTGLWKDKSLGTIIGGSSSQFVKGDGSLDSNTYLTTISGINAGGELSGTYPNPNLVNSAVTGKVLTGLSVSGSAIVSTDSLLTAFGKLQNQLNALAGGVSYQGTWNASTNTPTLASSVGTKGYYYVVSVAGSTNLNGITDWKLGDWVIYDGSAWQKVDNTDAVVSVNGYTGIVTLAKADIGLGNVENTALSTWAGSTNIVSVGTIGTGVWQGTAIADTYISSASTWNAKIGGSGTSGKIAKFTASGTIGNSIISESGGTILVSRNSSAVALRLQSTSPYLYPADFTIQAGGYGSPALVIYDNTASAERMLFEGSQIITATATNTGEHFIVGGSARVNGDLSVVTSSGSNLYVKTTADTTPYFQLNRNNTTHLFGIYINSAGKTIFENASASLLTIDTSGNVGIGTTSPSRRLHISTTSNGIPLRLETDGSNTGIEFIGGNTLYNFFIGKQYNVSNVFEITPSTSAGGTTFSNPALAITSSGSVGIGTTSPVYKTQIVSDGNALLQLNGKNTSGALDTGFTISADDSKNIYLYQRENAFLDIGVNNTSRMRITSGGNVLIGTTTDAGYKLDVSGTARVNGSSGIPSLQLTTSGSNFALMGILGNQTGDVNWLIMSGYPNAGDFTIRESDTVDALRIAKTTGAATFSSSVTAGADITIGSGGSFAAGSIYSDSFWGMIFKAKQASPSISEFAWFKSNGTQLMAIKSNNVLNLSSIPTSSSGLSTGDIWSDGGTLKIV